MASQSPPLLQTHEPGAERPPTEDEKQSLTSCAQQCCQSGGMNVTNCNSDRVRCIIRSRRLIQTQDQACHLLHLRFGGPPIPYERLFDLKRCVFVYRQAGIHQCQKHNSTRLPNCQRCTSVTVEEQFFDSGNIWVITPQQCLQFLVDHLQPLW